MNTEIIILNSVILSMLIAALAVLILFTPLYFFFHLSAKILKNKINKIEELVNNKPSKDIFIKIDKYSNFLENSGESLFRKNIIEECDFRLRYIKAVLLYKLGDKVNSYLKMKVLLVEQKDNQQIIEYLNKIKKEININQ